MNYVYALAAFAGAFAGSFAAVVVMLSLVSRAL